MESSCEGLIFFFYNLLSFLLSLYQTAEACYLDSGWHALKLVMVCVLTFFFFFFLLFS
jgi:hypothetical protein